MPYTVGVETVSEITIGSRTIRLRGTIPDSNAKAFELAYHATSLTDAVDIGTLTDACNSLMTYVAEIGPTLGGAFNAVRTNLGTLVTHLPPSSTTNNNPMSLLKKVNDAVQSTLWTAPTGANAPGNFDPSPSSPDIRTYVTDIVAKVAFPNGEPLQFEIGLAFEFTGATIFNITLKRAGILLTLTKAP
jgi:hypothetical protein